MLFQKIVFNAIFFLLKIVEWYLQKFNVINLLSLPQKDNMKQYFFLYVTILALQFFNFTMAQDSINLPSLKIIPTPQVISYHHTMLPIPKEIGVDFSSFIPNHRQQFIFSQLQDEFLQIQFYKQVKKMKAPFVIAFSFTSDSTDIGTQGYRLVIDRNGIAVSACSDRGIFYGYQTVRQILREALLNRPINPTVRAVEIIDYPALPYRGWMDDVSRGPIPSLDFLKEEIRTLASYKMNCMTLYTEHLFRSKYFGEYAPEEGLTEEELMELQRFAENYFVEIVGNQQALAHAEKILQHPKYHKFADTKYNFNPALEDTYLFFDTLLSEMANVYYSSHYFHINGDEADGLGQGFAKSFVDSIGGQQQAYLYYMARVGDILHKNGKQMMMWGDIVGHDNNAIAQLPKDAVLIAWSYDARENFRELLAPLVKSGHEFWIAPGVSCWHTVFPDSRSYLRNIANFTRDAASVNATGMFNTAWDDYGESLFSGTWHAQIWGAELSWNPISENSRKENQEMTRLKIFNQALNLHFFHRNNQEENWAEALMKISSLNDSPIKEMCHFSSLWQPIYPFYPDQVEDNQYQKLEQFIQNQLLPLSEFFDQPSSPNENSLWRYADYALNRYLLTCKNHQIRCLAYKLYKKTGTEDDEKLLTVYRLEALALLQKVKNTYFALWDQECRPYWKGQIEQRFQNLLQSLETIFIYPFIEVKTTSEGEVGVVMRTLKENDNTIYYTIDGSIPTNKSNSYDNVFTIDKNTTIRALTMCDSVEAQNIYSVFYHQGIKGFSHLGTSYSRYRDTYSGGGINALSDGLHGSNRYNDGYWQGYQSVDAELYYQFSDRILIDSIKVRYLQNFGDWILAPNGVDIFLSEDGKDFRKFTSQECSQSSRSSGIGEIEFKDLNLYTKYLKIVVKNPKKLPQEHPSAGNDAYIFLDEIEIY